MSFRILSSPERLVLGGGLAMQPFVRYVLPAGPAQGYALALKKQGVEYTMSVFNPYFRPYGGSDLNGKRLAFYRHAAYGDQLMATSVPVYLKHLFPKAQIDVYASPEVLDIWRGLPVKSYPAPLIFEATRAYDFHLFYDQMLEEDREPDQENAFDSMFAYAGFKDAPDVFKRPKVVPEDQDFAELEAMGMGDWIKGKYLVYQLGAGNANRTYPPAQGGEFVRQFLNAYPGWTVVLVGIDREGNQLREFMDAVGPWQEEVVCLVNQLRHFRSLIPLVQNAGLVVCPDSSIGHLAAAFPRVPVISLWGLFAPSDRAKYYPNHRTLWPRTICPHAPCHNHEFKLPQKLCAAAKNAESGEQKWCNVLRAISPKDIGEMVESILGPAQ